LTPLYDGLESRPCPTYLLGTGVRDASILIDPRNRGAHVTREWVHPLMDGHLTGAQLTLSRHYRVGIWRGGGLVVPTPFGYVTAFGEAGLGWKRGRVQSPNDF
jgi:hypothetical protein